MFTIENKDNVIEFFNSTDIDCVCFQENTRSFDIFDFHNKTRVLRKILVDMNYLCSVLMVYNFPVIEGCVSSIGFQQFKQAHIGNNENIVYFCTDSGYNNLSTKNEPYVTKIVF